MITNDVELCVNALTQGDLVAFPTETVYGLGARADSPQAISKIFEIKGRPLDHPLIMHCSDVEIALAISPYIPEYAKRLAKEFWPGPMTLIFKRAANDAICDEAVGGQDTVAIRVPSNEIARRLLEPCSFFVAAPSANKYGQLSPTTSRHVQEEFDDEIIILDGERSSYGLESTIVSCVDDQPVILRAGAITKMQIQNAVDMEIAESGQKSSTIAVSGNKESHYAPSIPLLLIENDSDLTESEFDPSNCAFIGGRETQLEFKLKRMVSTYEQYAFELYDFFHEAQNLKCKAIFAVRPENEGVGVAINDRLTKAAASYGSAND